jgi:hypothetical protein
LRKSHRSLGSLLLAASLTAAAPAASQNVQSGAPRLPITHPPEELAPQQSIAASSLPPFAYRFGQTTLDAARAYWSQNGMKVLRAGHLAVGAGSGWDGRGKTVADRVILVDVSGVEFEGISTARFGFYENTLYRIQASLTAKLGFNVGGVTYTPEQINELYARLKKEYGYPSESYHTIWAAPKGGIDLMIWKIKGDTLILSTNILNGNLSLTNDKIETDVKGYIKDHCKDLRACT